MGTFKRIRITNLDAAPNQILPAPASGQVINLVGYHIDNTDNSAASYVGFFNNTSGVVTVGTTPSDYGRIPVAAYTWNSDRSGTQQDPLMIFDKAVTVFAATTKTGNTSPVNDLSIELFYYI